MQRPALFDWNGLGTLVSIASVLFLGAAVSDKPYAPWQYYPVLVAGMATSILGLVVRYRAHLHRKLAIAEANSNGGSR